MSEYCATVEWQRSGEFSSERYSRAHTLRFGGISVAGNAAPGNIPASVAAAPGVDPEQAFVAALSSCHMLWFLHLVTLRPRISFSGRAPSAEELRALHHSAHEKCFIANSVKSEVVVEPC